MTFHERVLLQAINRQGLLIVQQAPQHKKFPTSFRIECGILNTPNLPHLSSIMDYGLAREPSL